VVVFKVVGTRQGAARHTDQRILDRRSRLRSDRSIVSGDGADGKPSRMITAIELIVIDQDDRFVQRSGCALKPFAGPKSLLRRGVGD
jgi:hypothetical protein